MQPIDKVCDFLTKTRQAFLTCPAPCCRTQAQGLYCIIPFLQEKAAKAIMALDNIIIREYGSEAHLKLMCGGTRQQIEQFFYKLIDETVKSVYPGAT